MLQYYLNIPNPELLTDEEWATKFEVLQFIRQQEAKQNTVQ